MRGLLAVILCSPTGSGKTVTFADIARESVSNGYTVMIAVDRSELLTQAKDKLIEYGLNPSIITAGRTAKSGANCYVATVQTLKRRVFPEIDLLIIDEAHKQIFDKVVLTYKAAGVLCIGATATPKRSGNMTQLSDVYDDIVEAIDIPDLIDYSFLVPAITYSAKKDTSDLKVKGNDFEQSMAAAMFDKKYLYDGMVEKYQKLTPNTKAICFNQNVENSIKAAKAFNDAGISAVHVDGTTPKKQRDDIFAAFKKGIFKILCNVDIATTGFDEWTIETVIVNRVTMSLPLWLQMTGRGSRITPEKFQGVPGYLQKTHFNILDMGGNLYRMGFWEQKREWNLTHKKRETAGVAPVKECKEDEPDINNKYGCGAMLHASAPTCKFCGYVFPKPEPKLLESEFIQVENYQLLPPELIGKSWGVMTIAELESVRVAKKYKAGWIIRQISMNQNLHLIDYAIYKEYKNPVAWVAQTQKIYNLPPDFYYYYSEEYGVFKCTMKVLRATELTYEEFEKGLAHFGLEDGNHLLFENIASINFVN